MAKKSPGKTAHKNPSAKTAKQRRPRRKAKTDGVIEPELIVEKGEEEREAAGESGVEFWEREGEKNSGPVGSEVEELDYSPLISSLSGEESAPGEEGEASAGETEALVIPASGSLARLSPLQRYLQEIRHHPILSREEEQALAEAYYERGDLEAARKLVTLNLRLVVKIAFEYYRHWMDLLDLIQEGNLGLVQAVKKFDPYRGIRLSTYASFWIRAYILKFLMDNWRLVKIGTTQAQRKLFFNLKKEKERLEQMGFKPGARMLARALAVKEAEVVEMEQRLATRDESLDVPVSEDGRQNREDLFADDQPEVDEVLADEEFASLIRSKLEQFRQNLATAGRKKELFLFDHRLMSENPLTLQEVGEKFGVSRERVRQLEARLLQNLKAFLKQEMPDFEDYDFIN